MIECLKVHTVSFLNKTSYIFLLFLIIGVDSFTSIFCIITLLNYGRIQNSDYYVDETKQVILTETLNELSAFLILFSFLIIFTICVYIIQKKIEKLHQNYNYKYGKEFVSEKLKKGNDETLKKNKEAIEKYKIDMQRHSSIYSGP